MERTIHVVILIFVTVIVFLGVIFGIVDLFGRVDYLKENVPGLGRILERRSGLAVLLLVAIFLLLGVGYEVVVKEFPEEPAPIVKIMPPLAPLLAAPTEPTPKPVPRELGPKAEPPVLTGIRIASQRRIPSDDPKLPYGLEVVIQTDTNIEPVAIALICSGAIGKADAGFSNGGAYTMRKQGFAQGRQDVLLVEWKTPAWTPQDSIVVNLFSEASIEALSVSRFNYAWP